MEFTPYPCLSNGGKPVLIEEICLNLSVQMEVANYFLLLFLVTSPRRGDNRRPCFCINISFAVVLIKRIQISLIIIKTLD